MRHIPEILNNTEFLKEEINVKWDKDSTGYFLFKAENDKLIDALETLNHKAIMGLTAALSEWVFWRISDVYSTDETLIVTDAIWLGLIDKNYIVHSKSGDISERDIYDDILWITYKCLDEIRYNYTIGSYRVLYRVVNLTMLARYITPSKEIFDNWLNDCIKRSAKFFPAQYNSVDVNKHPKNYPASYDSSNELPIPREFYFEPNFDYETADIDKLLEKFVNEVDHSDELLFKPAKQMIAEGFQGTPYKYEPK